MKDPEHGEPENEEDVNEDGENEDGEGEDGEDEDGESEDNQSEDDDAERPTLFELSPREMSNAALPLRTAHIESFPSLDAPAVIFNPYQNGHVISHGVVYPAHDVLNLRPLPLHLNESEESDYRDMLVGLDPHNEVANHFWEHSSLPWLRIDALIMIVVGTEGKTSEIDDVRGWLNKVKALASESPDDPQIQMRLRLMEWARWQVEQVGELQKDSEERLTDLTRGGGVGGWVGDLGTWNAEKDPSTEEPDKVDGAVEEPEVSSPGGGHRWAFR